MTIIAYLGFEPKHYRDYVIQIEPLEKCIGELTHLHKLQWDEIEEDRPPFKPNYLPFYLNEKENKFFQVNVRKDNHLVGGVGFFLFDSMHTSLLTANETAFFLLPEHRKGMLAMNLLKYSDNILKNLGVYEIIVTVKSYAKTGRLIERLDFKQSDTVYIKMVK
jgi:hypothetical protein